MCISLCDILGSRVRLTTLLALKPREECVAEDSCAASARGWEIKDVYFLPLAFSLTSGCFGRLTQRNLLLTRFGVLQMLCIVSDIKLSSKLLKVEHFCTGNTLVLLTQNSCEGEVLHWFPSLISESADRCLLLLPFFFTILSLFNVLSRTEVSDSRVHTEVMRAQYNADKWQVHTLHKVFVPRAIRLP